jgi:uncharacterized lipoprotein YmbA
MTLLRRDLLGHAGLMLALAGCANGPAEPPPRYYRLRIEPPEPAPARPAAPATPWQLVGRIKLPEHLDREPMWLPFGASGLQPLEGHRWAEPLRDAVPRLLRHDLELLRGPGSMAADGTPGPGAVPMPQLRVEVLMLEPAADRRSVQLLARWSLTRPGATALAQQARVQASSAAPEPDALVAAHRLALWRLAEHIAQAGR